MVDELKANLCKTKMVYCSLKTNPISKIAVHANTILYDHLKINQNFTSRSVSGQAAPVANAVVWTYK